MLAAWTLTPCLRWSASAFSGSRSNPARPGSQCICAVSMRESLCRGPGLAHAKPADWLYGCPEAAGVEANPAVPHALGVCQVSPGT